VYEQETAPVLDWYRVNGDKVVVVNAVGPVEDITKSALAGLRK
jgi:adenylate kinase family enzyme